MKRFSLATFILLFLSFVLLGSLLINVRFILSSRASSGATSDISALNSYLFMSPLQARADGEDTVRVTVVVLDNTGSGVQGKRILLEAPKDIDVSDVQAVSDSYGKAIFDLRSKKAQTYEIKAFSQTVQIGETSSVIFTP